jgi:hypothetical protein
MRHARNLTVAFAIGITLCASMPAAGQTNEWGQTILGGRPDDNVRAAGARSPGSMVNAGVARGQLASQFAQSPIEITDPTPTDLEPRQVFLISAIDILFEDINGLLLFFTNLLRERAGLDPVVPEAGTITGVVTSAEDDEPIRDATVTVFDENDEEVATATTNRNGEYTISDLEPGDYLLEITAEDFDDEVIETVTVQSTGGAQEIDVELQPDQSAAEPAP